MQIIIYDGRSMGKMMKRFALAISGLIPLLFLLNNDPTLLIYSIFVLVYFLKPLIQPFARRIPFTTLLLFILIFFLGILSEYFVWLSVRLSGVPTPEINPDLFLHLRGIYLFYIAKSVAWVLVLHLFRFSLPQVFITQGIFGILIEQQGAVLLAALANPLGIIWFPYVALVYGSYVATGFMLVEGRLNEKPKSEHWIKYPVALLIIGASIAVFALVGDLILKALS